MIVLGISALSLTPLCCTCLEEISFPVPESLSLNFMFFTSNLFSLLISILVTMPQTGIYGTWILPATLFPFFIYILFWYKTDFNKSQHEGIFGSFNPKIEKEFEEPTTMTCKTTNGDLRIDQDQTQDYSDFENHKLHKFN